MSQIGYDLFMDYKNLTYENCKEVVSKGKIFAERIETIEGFKISLFDYIVSVYDLFKSPFPGSLIDGYELRGLTFIHLPDGSHMRYLMMKKFFNFNENEELSLIDFSDKKIISVTEKLDGSLIRFIRLPNGKVLAKTIGGFTNSQSKMANKVYEEDLSFQGFINESLDKGLACFFELTSPQNRIVLPYSKTELTLIQIRKEDTGEYVSLFNGLPQKYGVSQVKEIPATVEELTSRQLSDTNVEGWIVLFEDAANHQFILKFKTAWYFNSHKALDEATRENHVIGWICSDKIDDMMTQITSEEVLDKVLHIQKTVNNYLLDGLVKLKKYMALFDGDKKAFYLKYFQEGKEYVPLAMKLKDSGKDDKELMKVLKEDLAKKTATLNKAIQFIKDHE